MAEAQKTQMEYRLLGPSGLKVSVIGFGNWLTSDDPKDADRTKNLIKKAFDNGVNFFDTAEAYGSGKGEIAFGKAFKELNLPREQLVISTKLFWGGSGPNDVGLCRKHVIEGANNCLKRLQVDYIDILLCHRPDFTTPVEETCRAFNYLIDTGKIFYWGTSEWPADRIMEAYAVCDRLGLVRPIAEQCQYSLLVREKFEKEYSLLFRDHNMGSTIWSPMANGLLSGKYNESIPEGSRLGSSDHAYIKNFVNTHFSAEKKDETFKRLQSLGDIAKEIGCTQAQLALGWTLSNPNVSVCLNGATSEAQIDDNVKAVEAYKKLTPEILARMDKVFDNKPEAHFDYRQMAGLQKRR